MVDRTISTTNTVAVEGSDLEDLTTSALLDRIISFDRTVVEAVAAALSDLTVAVELAVASLKRGGRIRYVGAGTSGRLGVLDAAELPPTFGISPYMVSARVAGGDPALRMAIEGAEDLPELGRDDVADLQNGDILIALTASGRTPYIRGALTTAKSAGVHAVLVTATPNSPLEVHADLTIVLDVGAEVLGGSTRMKAGTAQKLVLNAFSTAVMVKMGHTYRSQMIDVVPTNDKLKERAVRMLQLLTEATAKDCQLALDRADGSAKVALVSLLTGTSTSAARSAIQTCDGYVAAALALLK